MKYHGDDAIADYLALVQRRPELFRNESSEADGAEIIEILTDRAEIVRAQEESLNFRRRYGLSTADMRAGLLAEDPHLVLIRDAVRFPDGSLGLYNRILDVPSVAAIPILDGKLVLVHVFRHGLRSWALEFPRGSCDPGESPERAIRRELREEIGAGAVDLLDLGEFTPGGSTLATRATLFAAKIDRIGRLDRSEAIQKVHVLAVAEVERMIRAAEIIDGWTMSMFLRARLTECI